MFKYDEERDEYIEVLTNEDVQREYSAHRRNSLVLSSRRSSKYSIRSYNLNLPPSRIITRNGHVNIFKVKVPKKYIVYFRDLGNTLLNIRWRWIIITLFLVNFVSFFAFGLLWMFIAYISGDFEANAKDVCIVNTNTFTGYVLLSIETMLTIGYGYRYPTEKCIQGWIVPFLQGLISVGIQGVLVSAIYVKIAKPIKSNSFGLFSKKALVHLRDGKLCFVIRIADLYGKVAIATNVTMYFVNKEQDTFNVQQMKTEPFGIPIFPVEVVHMIDHSSPLWTITPEELLLNPVEVIAVAEGVSIKTGQPSQSRISYINSDIMWGHRFEPCVTIDKEKEKYLINCERINTVHPFDTPLCSGRTLSELRTEILGE